MTVTSPQELRGRVALVTGSSRGIGRGAAVELARMGARVVVNYRSHAADAEAVAAEVREAGGEALVHGADVGDPEQVDDLIRRTLSEWGRIDILVNNALRTVRKPFLELELKDLRDTWDVCLLSPFYCSQLAAREMVKQGEGGRIVMISSVLAKVAAPNSLPYNTAKCGLEQMARTMAAELTPHRITVNSIRPGWTDTPGERAFLPEEQLLAEAAKLPLGRLATIWEIGKAVAYLCSDAAAYITGSTLTLDGGYCLPRAAVPVQREEERE